MYCTYTILAQEENYVSFLIINSVDLFGSFPESEFAKAKMNNENKNRHSHMV